MKKPHQVALTGGIGSGKTTVLRLFKDKGVPCYIADEQAKKLMVESPQIIKDIKVEFGEEAFTKDQKLNTKYLSSKVFNNKEKLERLNNIVHPAVRKHFNNWVKKQNTLFVIFESALVFENNQQHLFDDIILVTAPVEERIKRVMKRSGLSKNDIKKRIERQIDDNLKIGESNYIINNTKIEQTIDKVNVIYDNIMNKI